MSRWVRNSRASVAINRARTDEWRGNITRKNGWPNRLHPLSFTWMRAVPAAPHPTQDKPATIKMTSYKLTYFDIKGLGEPIRMLLSILGKDFEDNRIPMASWSSRKSGRYARWLKCRSGCHTITSLLVPDHPGILKLYHKTYTMQENNHRPFVHWAARSTSLTVHRSIVRNQNKPGNNRMPSYKLTYFNAKGPGEPIRMLLAYMGVEFEDNRIEIESWPALQKEIKWGRIPVLEIDGKEMYQSRAIMRYLAKQAKLAGDNDWEAYEIDCAAGTVGDLMNLNSPMWKLKDETKEELKKKLIDELIPSFMKNWDEQAKNTGFLANGKLSWVDLYLHGWAETLEFAMGKEIINEYPNLKIGREKVHATPGIKEWLAKRPKTVW
ncbi:unnamed protein product [Nesidiocoris tenuis]|uniref:glutathione transferase n=1 Tax=Nesidiocoris tenuis TaxID=355587 RepID=A0A6H5G993_9HEMI|nr:unnamed protein product [Nesidiocoris tenuis]